VGGQSTTISFSDAKTLTPLHFEKHLNSSQEKYFCFLALEFGLLPLGKGGFV